ncbi:GNAT family N-acetyltransferase [Thioalkalivibrio sulfidiphilus]|uniref:GNAT family N-acetyltransferase n=1 Tax=Thioalkalivibrio sulfidiphilus TaxID=1033854 RepID=UPI003B2A003E
MLIDLIRPATPADAEAIARLVNLAYRPLEQGDDAVPPGWTHECDLLSGARISATQVHDILVETDSVVLLGLQGTEPVACVHVRKDGQNASIGMLAVNPRHQGLGLGKQMLDLAERFALEHYSAQQFIMSVVCERPELMAFYLRRGYRPTGTVLEYPLKAGVGQPKRAGLMVEILGKLSSNVPGRATILNLNSRVIDR